MSATPAEILTFWFGGADLGIAPPPALQRRWFLSDPTFDAEITHRFGGLLDATYTLDTWPTSPAGALATIVVFDQFPRNVFRGSARAFATDARAHRIATSAVQAGFDLAMGVSQRAFVYLPFEHAEDAAAQDRALALFRALAADAAGGPTSALAASYLDFARQHHATIARFGRFPGRNAALGRAGTAEEAAWLASGGATWGQGKR